MTTRVSNLPNSPRPRVSLKNSESPPSTRTPSTPASSVPSPSPFASSSPTKKTVKSPQSSARPKTRVGHLFRKATSEFGSFFQRIKSLGDEVFNENQAISELFDTSDADSLMDRIERISRGYNVNEEKFLLEYKKHKNLDKIYMSMQQRHYHGSNPNEEIKSSSTVYSDSGNNIGVQYGVKEGTLQEQSETLNDEVEDDDEMAGDDQEDQECSQNSRDKITFHDIDLVHLRQEYEEDKETKKNSNIGELLWEYRRAKWVQPTKTNSQAEALETRHFFDQIPKDSYVKVYNYLVEKGRPLKAGRRINLSDFMKVVNAGWEVEEKWDRAARGLA
ncbi:hypothetical protein PSN45_002790 [Yamadazyma tenuis]|uniref:Gag1-like clamp domain-containing protein n=1 Tax=Candida tenuis (strain ATCC 10573 / BCRC 21748 / CBS 615 / JCM 9827 / NBRC 10315 / NRRL Y-1498 / VKM Y-70) TaxID=590646 RepID=G3AWR5_CANTC|nr:uncharacterized protein CANTEDRAFT_112314 [Yamadazyma tenuis ATCC 10573]EGV66594.1 hypothetical protein CANTEDRAFT_112314 [Yamadazyma tenuis ATCC 10573]WEJ95277.1 hypothetical protein PSN45_002790 [Yamadazyma tenuis]